MSMLTRKDAMKEDTSTFFSKDKTDFQKSGVFGQAQSASTFQQAPRKDSWASNSNPFNQFQQSQQQQAQTQGSMFGTSLPQIQQQQSMFDTKQHLQHSQPQQSMFQPQAQQQQSLFPQQGQPQSQGQQSMFAQTQQSQPQTKTSMFATSQPQSQSLFPQTQSTSLFPGSNTPFSQTTSTLGGFQNPTQSQPQQNSWLTPTQSANTGLFGPINPTQQQQQMQQNQMSVPLLNSFTPTPEQLAQLFIPKQVTPESIITNKELTLLNNPSLLRESENKITQAIGKWMKDMMMSNIKGGSTELLNAPLVQLLAPPAIRSFLPILYGQPTFITKIPEKYQINTIELTEGNKVKQNLPNVDFDSCRHLPNKLSKQSQKPMKSYTDLYKQIGFSSNKRNTNRKNQSSILSDPYSNLSRSMLSHTLQPQNTKNNDSQSIKNLSYLYNKDQQSIYPSLKQLPIIHQYTSTPTLQKLSKLTRDQLKRVPTLKIQNGFGSVEFTEPINVLNKDFDQLISIEPNVIEVKYPLMDERLEKGGNNIYLVFYNFSSYVEKVKGKGELQKKFKKAMIDKIKGQEMMFIEFDERNGNLTVKI